MIRLSKLYRTFTVSALSVVLFVSAIAHVSAANYTDVSERYKEAVDYLVVKEITEGLTASSFRTEKPVKRVDAAILLVKAMELDIENVPASKFTDVPDRAKKYVDVLKAKGIVNGKTAEKFASDQLITRGEAALMLAEAYALEADTLANTFTDVSSKYENAVNALLNNKVTSGKTKTAFGVEQALTRGEFAIFLHKLSAIHITKSEVSVATAADLSAALSNHEVGKVVLTNSIQVAKLPVITRNINIDLNGHMLTGNIVYEDHSGTSEIQLLSKNTGGKLQGDLTINAPESDFSVGENVEITGKTTIINVKENTFYNNGVLNTVDIKDEDGISFVNHANGSINGTIALNTTGTVKLSGKMDSVEVNQAATVTIDISSTINNLNIKVGEVVLNAPAGTIETIEAAQGVIVKDANGKQIATQPAIEITPPYQPAPTAPVVIDVDGFISSYEAKQKIYIEAGLTNEDRTWGYYDLGQAREQLNKELTAAKLSAEEIERLKLIDSTLDKYLVESYSTILSIYADEIDLWTSDSTGLEIEWTSSHPNVISTEGKVARPARGEAAIEVTLTAKITKNAEAKTVDYKVEVEPEENIYTKAISLSTDEWEDYSIANGYLTSRLVVRFDFAEIKKDYPGVQKAKVIINQFSSDQKVKTLEDLNLATEIAFDNPIKDTYYIVESSVNVVIELLNEDNSVNTVLTNQVIVENLMPAILERFEIEKNVLNMEAMYKYIPNFNDYTSDEKSFILTNFNALPSEQMTLEKLQLLAAEHN